MCAARFVLPFIAVADDIMGPNLERDREERHARWLELIKHVRDEVYSLYHHRAIWSEVSPELLKDRNEQVFESHYTHLYVDRQAVAVRRLVDRDPRSKSMTRLLIEMAEHPETMTRARHRELYGISSDQDDHEAQGRANHANEVFDRYADGAGDNVDPVKVRADLDAWTSSSAKIKVLVDKVIAHAADLGTKPLPKATFKDLNKAIDTVGDFISKYTLLFEASSLMGLAPTIQSDWKAPLRRGLFIG